MNPDQDIRTMPRARAEGVVAAPMIPHGTLRRVRVRKMLMTGGVAAVVAALVFGGFAASRSLSNDAVPNPPADETEEKDPVVDFPALTETFVSPRNGFSVKHPDRVALTPAKDVWDPGLPCNGSGVKGCDGVDVVETGLLAVFTGASTQISDGVSMHDWVDDYVSDDYVLPGGCGVPRSQQAEITIDGQ